MGTAGSILQGNGLCGAKASGRWQRDTNFSQERGFSGVLEEYPPREAPDHIGARLGREKIRDMEDLSTGTHLLSLG